MDFEYNEKDFRALDKKAANPESVVICPRCGKELVFNRIGNSYEIICPTKNCLRETVRGL